MLKKWVRIIKRLKTNYCRISHKYDLRILKAVTEVKEIRREYGKTMWWSRQIRNEEWSSILWKLLIGFQTPSDTSDWMGNRGENFRCKVKFVSKGHKTESPPSTYSYVMLRDSLRMLLMIATLNKLDIPRWRHLNCIQGQVHIELTHRICTGSLVTKMHGWCHRLRKTGSNIVCKHYRVTDDICSDFRTKSLHRRSS